MSKGIIISKSKKRVLNLKILAQRKERIRRRLEVTAKQLTVIAKEKENIRHKLEITAKQLAVTAKERESVRLRLATTAKTLAATAKEKENTRSKLVTTAKALAVTAKERESVRLRLVTTAKTLAATAKEKEIIRLRLVQTADDLERSSAKNEAMLGAIGDGLIAVDNDRKIMFLNKVAVDMLGWKTNDLIGKLITELPLLDEMGNSVPLNMRPTTMSLKNDKRTAATYYFVRPDKTKFPASITVTPIKINNKTIGMIEVIRDITLEKEIDRAKSEFVSLASHQLKTPPTAIKLLTERLLGGKMGDFTNKQREYLSDIRSSNQRMINIINALLDVSRIELGAFSIKRTENDACALVLTILNESKLMIDEKQLKLKTIFPEKKVILLLDESIFRMIINNLILNAIHYTPRGGGIQVECKEANKGETLGSKLLPDDYFVVVVADTGYGIPQKDQHKLFTKFFRADNARVKQPDGTGLGLYIVKSALENSGGMIWFTSEENKGSIFYAAIPLTGMKAKIGVRGLT